MSLFLSLSESVVSSEIFLLGLRSFITFRFCRFILCDRASARSAASVSLRETKPFHYVRRASLASLTTTTLIKDGYCEVVCTKVFGKRGCLYENRSGFGTEIGDFGGFRVRAEASLKKRS
jgi:hypothetical protein